MSGVLLEAEGLCVAGRIGGSIVPVLRDLSFRLEAGRVLALVGESGAGKSMLGRTIAHDLPPNFGVSAGRLSFAGRDLAATPPRALRALLGREIAFIPQEPLSALNPVLTIGRQFDEHLARVGAGAARRERRERAVAALAAVQLPRPEALLAAYPHQLSGGMCQRVLIAMAFASRPRLVVADEPTTALDVTVQAEIMRLIRGMQERDGTAVLFITHDLRLAASIADSVLVLYAGRPAEQGPTRLLSRPAHPYTRCLELAAPSLVGPRRGLYALPEVMPGLIAARDLPGCRFAPRCPNVLAACEAGEPPLAAIGPGHVAACIRPEATADIASPPATAAGPIRGGTALLEAQGLTKTFPVRGRPFARRRVFTAVHEARLSLARGEFVGIIGESGSGKSTLARMIVGLEAPTQGRLLLDGQDVTRDGRAERAIRRRLVQMVFQDPQSALNPRRRVGSIVMQALEAAGTLPAPADRLVRAQKILAEVGLPPDAATRYPAQLSGGQKQRVNIARALAAEPELLVADEIVSGLDVSVQAQLMELLARLRRERAFSMLFISHDLSVVRHLCDRVVVMLRGEIVETGETDAVFRIPAHEYTRRLLDAVPTDEVAKPDRNATSVIPGLAESADPEPTTGHGARSWVPGSTLRAAPE